MKMLKNKKILIIYLFLLLVLMIAFDYRKGLISNNQVTLLTNTDNNVVVHKALNLPNINKLKAKYKNNDIKGFLYLEYIKNLLYRYFCI